MPGGCGFNTLESTIPMPANLTFGGGDYKTPFVTARTGRYSVRVNFAGIRLYEP